MVVVVMVVVVNLTYSHSIEFVPFMDVLQHQIRQHRTQNRPDRVRAVHEALDNTGIGHVSCPGTEPGVRQTRAKSHQEVSRQGDAERRPCGQDSHGKKAECWRQKCNSSTTKVAMDVVGEDACAHVACHAGGEDECRRTILDMVECADLVRVGMVKCRRNGGRTRL